MVTEVIKVSCWEGIFLQVHACHGTQLARWLPGIPSGLFHAAGKNVVVKADKWSVKIGLISFWSSGNEDLVADQMSDL